MKLPIAISLVITGALTASWGAGFTALTYYVFSGGNYFWDGMVDKCQEFEDNGGVVRGLDCIKNGVTYLLGAAAAFGGGTAGAEYIKNSGVTSVGQRSLPSPFSREWDWSAIDARPAAFVDEISKSMPGLYHHHDFNVTGHGIDNAISIMNMDADSDRMYAHVSNTTHGTVYMGTHKTDSSLERRAGSWDFAGWGGMKFSYSNPGCQEYSFRDADVSDQLNTEAQYFVVWANEGNKGSKYSLEWSDENRFGTPYVGGYLILEVNGFGTNYEGAPQIHDCVR